MVILNEETCIKIKIYNFLPYIVKTADFDFRKYFFFVPNGSFKSSFTILYVRY